MTYAELRYRAGNGDVLLVEGKAFFSRLVRVVTGESISHVAMLFWLADGLFVAEMIEGIGYRIMPASQWMRQTTGRVLYGTAPKVIQDRPGRILAAVEAYRTDKHLQSYGYWSLLKVWWAQLTGRNIHVHERVCSTFIQDAWERAGFHFSQTPDPGDYIALCQSVAAVEGPDAR